MEQNKINIIKYQNFQDEPELVPAVFHSVNGKYEKLIEQVQEDVELGVKVDDAVRLNAGISKHTVYRWKKAFFQELEDGKTDTPLIRLFAPAYQSDAKIYRKVMKMAIDKAEEGDASTIQFLAKNRLGYGRPQTNLNVDNSENNNIQISITPMKAIEADAPIDVKGEEVEGTKQIEVKDAEYSSRDDSYSAEMD